MLLFPSVLSDNLFLLLNCATHWTTDGPAVCAQTCRLFLLRATGGNLLRSLLQHVNNSTVNSDSCVDTTLHVELIGGGSTAVSIFLKLCSIQSFHQWSFHQTLGVESAETPLPLPLTLSSHRRRLHWNTRLLCWKRPFITLKRLGVRSILHPSITTLMFPTHRPFIFPPSPLVSHSESVFPKKGEDG